MSTGDHFVIQKGKAKCDKGSSFPSFMVTSHTHHYWNSDGASAGNLAVTEVDKQFNPMVQPFGSCSIKNGNPCSFAAAGNWMKTYDKTLVLGKKCVIESSELMCSTGGKITVLKHGQTAAVSQNNVEQADQDVQQELDPMTDVEELTTDTQFDYI